MSTINKNNCLTLKPTVHADLETLFAHQLDDEYAHMAAFVNERWQDKEAYIEKWNKLLNDGVNIWTIFLDDQVVGSVSTWPLGDEMQVSYGIEKKYWGKGLATTALQQFLEIIPERPLYGRVAFDNIGSARVLQKCRFKQIGEDKFYAHARKKEIGELIFILED